MATLFTNNNIFMFRLVHEKLKVYTTCMHNWGGKIGQLAMSIYTAYYTSTRTNIFAHSDFGGLL